MLFVVTFGIFGHPPIRNKYYDRIRRIIRFDRFKKQSGEMRNG